MIRRAAPGDLPRLLELWLAGNLDAHNFIPPAYWESQKAQVQRLLPLAEVWVYEEQGRVLGFLGLREEYLAGLFVDRASRGRGIGGHLLEQSQALRPCLELDAYQKNDRALSFYQSHGFQAGKCGIDEATGEAELHMVWRQENQ